MSTHPYRILAMDGGGVRGIITVVWLQRLELHIGAPIHETFDLILGTGVGAILGFALGLGISPTAMRGMWERCARTAFATAYKPGSESKGLIAMLREVFGDNRIHDLKTPTIGIAFDSEAQSMIALPSRFTSPDLPIWQVVDAATAYPLYVDPFAGGPSQMPFRQDAEGDFVIASFGTGRVDGLDTASAVFGERSMVLRQFLGQEIPGITLDARFPSRNYWRFQTSVPARISYIDGIENIDELQAIASAQLADGTDATLHALASRLRGRA